MNSDHEEDEGSQGQGDQEQELEEFRLPTHICINCSRPFAKNLRGTNLLQIDFVDNTGRLRGSRELSVLGVLDTVFRVTKDLGQSNAGMCTQCARVLSHVYTYYANLMELSNPDAPVCKIVHQFKAHFNSTEGTQEQGVTHEYDDQLDIPGDSDEEHYEVEAYYDNGLPDMKPVIGQRKTRGRKPGRKPKAGRGSNKKSKGNTEKSSPNTKSLKKTKGKRRTTDDNDNSDAEPKPKRSRGRKTYEEIRLTESERARRARMMETPDARAIRLFKDAERKRLQRRLLKEDQIRKDGGDVDGGGMTDSSSLVGETMEQRKARLARDAENKRKRRSEMKADKEQGQSHTEDSAMLELNSSSSRPAEESEAEAEAEAEHTAPEFNYESLLNLAGIGS